MTIDHLVVMAASLEQGVAWCEALLGVTPGPGGEHPLMGTHNRLLKVATQDFPQAYLEIIAINSVAAHATPTRSRRWFDMDDPAVRERVQRDGPQLIHWVAAVDDIAATVAALAVQGIDRGDILPASRQTPTGLLQWQISVRPDGQRLFDGCLPTLIQWGDTHPTRTMPSSGVTLHGMRLRHPQADALHQALATIGLTSIAVIDGPAQLNATLQTPKGLIEIHT
jgi:hypothetical protein